MDILFPIPPQAETLTTTTLKLGKVSDTEE